MIPTTAGTEATPNAIVAVPEKELKVGIVNLRMIAGLRRPDAVMVKKLPRLRATADAPAHATSATPATRPISGDALRRPFRPST